MTIFIELSRKRGTGICRQCQLCVLKGGKISIKSKNYVIVIIKSFKTFHICIFLFFPKKISQRKTKNEKQSVLY